MPVSLHQIATNTATVSIPLEEGTLEVAYYPGRVTERVILIAHAFQSLNDAKDVNKIVETFGDFNKTLAHLIHDWDLFEDKAMTVKFPIGEGERFSELALELRVATFLGITGNIRPEAIAPRIKN